MADAADRLHPSGRWQRAPNDPASTPSLLLPAIRGALSATDPRTLATLAAIHDELMDDLFVYRFRQDARPLGDAEGAFVLCGFLLALSRTPAPLPRTCRYNPSCPNWASVLLDRGAVD